MKEFNAERVWKTKVGLTAVVVQVMRGERDGKPVKSHYCGYVGVPKDHALYEVPYDNLDISVHGGLTYASLSDWYPMENSDEWWFGFDCAHSRDAHHEDFYEYMRSICPESPTLWQPSPGSVFRTLEYCANECEQLAEQLDDFVKLIEEQKPMKDQDIKLPKIDDSILSDSSGLWLYIIEWYKATVDKPSLSWELEASKVDNQVKNLMTEYAREAVRLNQPIATNDQPIPFDLEAAKRGEPIVTRSGRKVRFVAHVEEADEQFSVICLLEGNLGCTTYDSKGVYAHTSAPHCDLFMAPKPKRVVYLNIDRAGYAYIHETKEKAKTNAHKTNRLVAYEIQLPIE